MRVFFCVSLLMMCFISAGDELYPIALLVDELKSDDSEVRIKSVRRLRTIAQALGHERTRTELIPFINREYALFIYPVLYFRFLLMSVASG